MSDIEIFQEEYPSLESYWRSIILFGKNVASYKFALSKSLLEIAPTEKNIITLEELAEPFARHLCEHLKIAPKQVTSNSSSFLDACKMFNEQQLTKQELLDITVKKGFNNVIDAFHIVNSDNIPVSFYKKDFSGSNKKIILTDEIFKLSQIQNFYDLTNETEARWRLVETAWELGISRNLIDVKYDDTQKLLFVENNSLRRKDVTSARDALNGYQKGKCFYCFDDISINSEDDNTCDVDHFFPKTLQSYVPNINLDGVWNLVLACDKCNRGSNGKFAKVPSLKYLNRLHKRNEFLISSHHPLRETLMKQTGKTTEERINFLKEMDKLAINLLVQRWETEQVSQEVF